MKPDDLPAVIDVYGKPTDSGGILVISRTRPPSDPATLLPADMSLSWCAELQSAGDLPADLRASLGIVFDQLEYHDKAAAAHLLGRLRDRHCQRVVVCLGQPLFTEREMLALGYLQQKRPSVDGRLFLFDPELFFTKRDWSTPSH